MSSDKVTRILSHIFVALLSAMLTVALMMGLFIFSRPAPSKLEVLEQLIMGYFIGEKDQTAMEDAAAHAMVGALGDRWSYYIPADQYAAYKEQMENAYVGIGVTIQAGENGAIQVTKVTAGGPAEEAGVKVGDSIVAVEGQSIQGKDLDESKKMIQGDENTQVQITVCRGEEEISLTITRKRIQTPVAQGQLLNEDTGLVTIYNFNSNCAAETIAAIESLMEQGAAKLIFDVRNNPGGYAQELVKILDYLLPEGKLFTTVDYTGKEHTDMSDAKCLNIPMAVLVNGNSYSAAEFFAAAMAEYEAAVVVGEKTTGKGYFQSTFQLPDGSAVGLSIGKYYTPQGKNLADVGVTPNIQVQPAEGQTQPVPMEDPQVLAAIEALRK